LLGPPGGVFPFPWFPCGSSHQCSATMFAASYTSPSLLVACLYRSADRWLSQAPTLALPWYQPASMQQGEVPGFSRTMRRQMTERWDSTAFHLLLGILPSGFPLSIRPSRTRSFVIWRTRLMAGS